MSTIKEYLSELSGRRVTVIGMGVSNIPLIKMLLRAGVEVTVRDRSPRERLAEQAQELESLGAQLILGEDYLKDLPEELIFRTPGLSSNTPELLDAVQRGAALSSEMEVFFQTCPGRLIGVTGSDGKTTTTTIIAEFLKEAGKNVYVGGNIGRPLLADVADMVEEDYAVLELSSFQLMTMDQSPHIAVMTNLSPNHLDVHKSYEEYISAKENIFTHQTARDIAIFNADNEATVRCAEKAPGRVRWFSRQKEVADGVFLRGTSIVCRGPQGERVVLDTADIKLPGVHNIENYMAAIAAVDGIVPDKCVRAVALRFQGVEHRIELVRTYRGVKFYNDSIASSPSRTIAGLRSFKQQVILIAGGYDKHIPFDVLGPEVVEHVKLLILCGATADKIRAAVENAPGYEPGKPEILDVTPFERAVETARDRAEEGDIVTLSPACAAFDQFKNFMERGKTFKKIVNGWE